MKHGNGWTTPVVPDEYNFPSTIPHRKQDVRQSYFCIRLSIISQIYVN